MLFPINVCVWGMSARLGFLPIEVYSRLNLWDVICYAMTLKSRVLKRYGTLSFTSDFAKGLHFVSTFCLYISSSSYYKTYVIHRSFTPKRVKTVLNGNLVACVINTRERIRMPLAH